MALPIRDQLKYWGIAAAVFMVALWFMGDVLLPFLLGGAIAYFLDPVADRLERLGLSRIMATGLITVAGVLYGLDKSYKPFTYFQLLLPIFASAIVGGLGSPLGAIAGGFVIAFSEVGITYAWKKVLGYMMPEALEPSGLVQLLATEYKFAVSFMILVIVLLFRPTGLFKGKSV